jgi:hypothetical protein
VDIGTGVAPFPVEELAPVVSVLRGSAVKGEAAD